MHVARMQMRTAFKIFVGKPEGRRSLRRNKCRLEENTEMDLRTTNLEGMKWMRLAEHGERCEKNAEPSSYVHKGRKMSRPAKRTLIFSRTVLQRVSH